MALDEGDLDRWRALSGLEAEGSSCEAKATTGSSNGSNIERVLSEGDTYIYTLCDGRSLRVRQQVEKGLSFQLWPSSLRLAQYAEEEERLRPGRWKDLIEANIVLNCNVLASAGGAAICFPLCWGQDSLRAIPEVWQHPELVVAADVIYHKHLFKPLLQTLKFISGPSTPIVLAHVRRWKDDKAFFAAARKLFAVKDITAESDKSDPPDGRRNESRQRGALRLYCLQLPHAEGSSSRT